MTHYLDLVVQNSYNWKNLLGSYFNHGNGKVIGKGSWECVLYGSFVPSVSEALLPFDVVRARCRFPNDQIPGVYQCKTVVLRCWSLTSFCAVWYASFLFVAWLSEEDRYSSLGADQGQCNGTVSWYKPWHLQIADWPSHSHRPHLVLHFILQWWTSESIWAWRNKNNKLHERLKDRSCLTGIMRLVLIVYSNRAL